MKVGIIIAITATVAILIGYVIATQFGPESTTSGGGGGGGNGGDKTKEDCRKNWLCVFSTMMAGGSQLVKVPDELTIFGAG